MDLAGPPKQRMQMNIKGMCVSRERRRDNSYGVGRLGGRAALAYGRPGTRCAPDAISLSIPAQTFEEEEAEALSVRWVVSYSVFLSRMDKFIMQREPHCRPNVHFSRGTPNETMGVLASRNFGVFGVAVMKFCIINCEGFDSEIFNDHLIILKQFNFIICSRLK